MSNPLKAFITYSHENKAERKELIKCLAGMQRRDELKTWYDNKLSGGDRWNEEIKKNLAKSDILIYLLSRDSLASDACNNEMIEAIKQGIRVVPVILEPCDWKGDQQIADLLVLPEDGKPINTWVPESAGWQNVVDGIRKTIKDVDEKKDTDSFAALQAGNALMIIKKFTEAIRKYSSAIKLKPDYADAYNNRGIAYAKKKKPNLAIDDYNKAIELDPNYAEAYSNRSNVYWGMNEHDRAIEDCNKAIELNPNLVEAYNNRGIAYGKKGEYDRAIEDFNKVLDLKPNLGETYNNRGITYGQKGKYIQAIADFNKVIELNPDYAEAYNNRGLAYEALDDHAQAEKDFKKAIELDPKLFKN